MECCIAVGTGIVKKAVEYTIEPVVEQLSYLTHSKSKLQALNTGVEDLVAVREGVQHKVNEAVRKGKSVETVVDNWKTRVDAMIGETGAATNFLKDERHPNTKCLYGFCPNLILRYRISRKSTKLLDEVVKLLSAEKEFPNFSYNIPPQEVCSTSTGGYTTSDSRISTVREIINELRNPDTDMILVSGIGGIGKTTLAEDVLRKAIEDKLFDDVVMVRDVKENPDLGRVQREIATKLGLEVLENQTLFERAPFLCDRMKAKKTLVILDDVWEALDLVAMGIPRVETCKILLTCRSRKELSLDSRKQKVFPLDILGEKDAWSLFEKMTGDIVKDHHIRNIATQVAKRCGGLPVLLVTVARSLKYRTTLHPWKDTLRRLEEIGNEELTRKPYLALEWSYNQLDEELKPLFLLCDSLFIRNSVNLSDLLKYGMGLGLFKNVKTIEEAENALYSLVEKLKDFGLLLDVNDDTYVRMHDLLYHVAHSIAARDAHALSVVGGELKEWPAKDVSEKCRSISLDCCSTARLPEVLQCPELEMFYLGRSKGVMQEFPCNFFQKVIKLKVLDLTGVSLVPSLPPSLQFLENLRTLCLDFCELGDISLVGQLGSLEILSFQYSKVKGLPKEIGQLTCLRLLDLTNCLDLEVISPNVISSLESLEDLRMRNSFTQWEDEGVRGERRNASISELNNLSHLTALQIHIPDADSLPADLFSENCLERYQISIGDSDVWKGMVYETSTLNTLNLKLTISNDLNSGLQMLLEKSEVLCLDGTEGTVKEGFPQQTHLNIINKVQLSNLRTLKMHKCAGELLLSSSAARRLIQLKHLRISGCPLLVEIVSRKECGEENDADIMFRTLEHLELRDLPNLARFCSGNHIKLPSLQILELQKCAKLGTFISDPVSENNIICKEIEEVDSKENSSLDDKITVSLFDEKVGLPGLKRLYIEELPKLMTIWHDQLPQDFDLQNLNSVVIRTCHSLRNIFPASLTVRGLQQLEKLEVSFCNEMEDIRAKEEGDVLIQTDSFPNLESLTLSGGKIWSAVVAAPAELFSKLKSICFDGWSPFSNQDAVALFFLEKLPNLEKIEERSDMVVDKGNGGGSRKIHVHVPLPRVTTLQLRSMDRLMNLGGYHNSQLPVAGPVLPNLETLVVLLCSRLKNLESSAISFRNLIRLEVRDCKEMRYLTTYEVAKSLVQLTTLQVNSCEVMTEIIMASSNRDDDGDNEDACETAFKQLRHLRLAQLPRLQGFCSGKNSIVKFPSLQTLYISKRLNKLKIVPHHDRTLQITEIEDEPLKSKIGGDGNMENKDNAQDKVTNEQ